MHLFGLGKKKSPLFPFDKAKHRAVILSSICTGEKTIGFQDLVTKKFHPCNKITTQKEIDSFARDYKIDPGEITTIY